MEEDAAIVAVAAVVTASPVEVLIGLFFEGGGSAPLLTLSTFDVLLLLFTIATAWEDGACYCYCNGVVVMDRLA